MLARTARIAVVARIRQPGSDFGAHGISAPASTSDIIDGRRSDMCEVGHIVTLITAIGSRRAHRSGTHDILSNKYNT
jgi:hypothetical protein